MGPITIEIRPASTYFYDEGVHQQYLATVPNAYRCHANTAVSFPTHA